MDQHRRGSQPSGSWVPIPDQSGFPPLPRSVRTIDLSRPPARPSHPLPNAHDPEGCHRSIRDHQRAHRCRIRRIIENEMKAEEDEQDPKEQQDLLPFRWNAAMENQPRLPSLRRAMYESGGDTVMAWEKFDRRTPEQRMLDEQAKRERETEVQKRLEEKLREEKERKEDDELRGMLNEVPTYAFPTIDNCIQFSSLLGSIQEQVQSPLQQISVINQHNPRLQLNLSQVLDWVQEDLSQQNISQIFLFSKDEFDKYCVLITDRAFHHLSADFRKRNYLPQLRKAQAQLRLLKRSNADLKAENERLKSGLTMIPDDFTMIPDDFTMIPDDLTVIPDIQADRPNYTMQNGTNHYKIGDKHSRFLEDYGDQQHQSSKRIGHQTEQQSERNMLYQGNNPTLLDNADMVNQCQHNSMNVEINMPESYSGLGYSREELQEIRKELRRERHDGGGNNYRLAEKKIAPTKKLPGAQDPDRFRKEVQSPFDSLPELDPITGYGTVVGVDEVGPIFDYSKIENVTMRGGAGPYSFLNEDEDEDYGDIVNDVGSAKSTVSSFSKAESAVGKGALNKIKAFTGDDVDTDDDNGHGSTILGLSNFSHTSSLKFTRHSDTISYDKNNKLWAPDASSSSSVSNPYASSSDSHYRKGRGGRTGPASTARGLIPLAPKEDPYAQTAQGFQFLKNKPDVLPPVPTWTTLDPKTGKTRYEPGAEDARANIPQPIHSWNPAHPSNTPLAATFGTENVVFASETEPEPNSCANAVTFETLKKFSKQQEQRAVAESVADYCEVAVSRPGSPNIPPSEPSAVAASLKRPFDSISVSDRPSLFVEEEDFAMTEPSELIEADVKANFITDISAMHDARRAPTAFEQRNQELMATNTNPASYINHYGDDNVVEFMPKVETRTREWNEKGEYVGEWKGEVPKRFVRGFQEMMHAREAEMAIKSKEYRYWKGMSLEERLERLSTIRQPIELWNGQPGADSDDLHEVQDLPAIYKERVQNRKARQRVKALADKAKAAKSKAGSTAGSTRSVRTIDTRDTIGRLGDCDEIQGDTSAGFETPQQSNRTTRTDGQLQEMLLRALDATPRNSRRSHRSTSGNISPTHSVASNSSTDVERGFALPSRLFAGITGSGNTVSSPRPSRSPSHTPSGASSAYLGGPWSPMKPPSSAGGRPPARSVSGNSTSTVRATRNAHLGARIYSGDGKTSLSQGTNVQENFAELLALDDSPLLTEPSDIDIDPPALTGDAQQQYDLARSNNMERGRVVSVRLHELPGGMPKFTPGAVANRVFGGLVQQFQLHPAKRTAVVVFVHSVEARAFVHHFKNVREKGTEQEIRALQMEVSWYRGAEAQSILPPQPNLLAHHLAASATRAILLHRVPLDKSHKTVSTELYLRLGKMLISLHLVTPTQNYLKASQGRRAVLEFASLADAIESHQMLRAGLVAGYEDSAPEYVMEGSGRQSTEKEYCGCLGCEERRAARAEEKERKERSAEAEVAEASARASARSETESVSARGRGGMAAESESGSD